MDERQPAGIKVWWEKYKKWIISLLAVYILLIIVLILLTGGPQRGPFQYQIF
jgi:ABC-type antimicrobial peptide transport system permease subunit